MFSVFDNDNEHLLIFVRADNGIVVIDAQRDRSSFYLLEMCTK